MLDQHTDEFPLVLYLLKALETIAVRLGLPLSDKSLVLFRNLDLSICDMEDVLVAFVLPVPLGMFELMPENEGLGICQMGMEVEELLRRQPNFELFSEHRRILEK